MLFVGANPCIGHPIMWERVLRNQNDPEIIVIDPRRTETASASTPASAAASRKRISNCCMRSLTRSFATTGSTTTMLPNRRADLNPLRQHVAAFTPAAVSASTGLSVEAIERAREIDRDRQSRVAVVDDGGQSVVPGNPGPARSPRRIIPLTPRPRREVNAATCWRSGSNPLVDLAT